MYLHYSNLASELANPLLSKISALEDLSVVGIPLREYPSLIQAINIYVKNVHLLKRVDLTVHCKRNYKGTLKDCEYLSARIPECTLSIKGSYINFEDMLLLIATSVLNRREFSVDMTKATLNHRTFLPPLYTTRFANESFMDRESFIKDVTEYLVPSVVARIRGVSEEQRQRLSELGYSIWSRSDQTMQLVKFFRAVAWSIHLSDSDDEEDVDEDGSETPDSKRRRLA